MHSNRFAFALIALFVSAGALAGQGLFSKPVNVLGDPNFIGTAANPLAFDSTGPNWIEGREVNQPEGIALDNSVSPPIVYIADTANNRVLAYQYTTQLTAGSLADLVLGQPNQYSNLVQGPGHALTTGLNAPTGLAVDSAGNLYVADSGNNRVVRYPKPFAQPAGYQFPDFIIGQTSFTGSTANAGGIKASSLFLSGGGFFPHTGLAFDLSGNLWVTDTGNNRVLRFPVSVLTASQNAPAADTVIGQTDFLSRVGTNNPTSTTNLNSPMSVAFDSSGNMLVADALGRVLGYTAGSTTNSQAAKLLGVGSPFSNQPSAVQAGFITSVVAAGNNVIVADLGFNRILSYGGFSTWPIGGTQISPKANVVVGQADFTSSMANRGGGPGANTLNGPVDLAASAGEVFVTDARNNRVLVFALDTPGPEASARRVIGQLDFGFNAPNLVVGQEFFTGQANALTSVSGSAILDNSSMPPHLYVADTYNNRILGFKDFTHATKGQKADIVIGQPDLLHTLANYPSNSVSTPNNQGLDTPTGMAVDSAGNLYVADTGNGRILRFPAPFASGASALETADLVLGQGNFTSIVTDATAATMAGPIGVAFTSAGFDATMNSGYLAVADVAQHRVLLFQKPFSSGMSASLVLGQPDFNSATASSAAAGMSAPFAVAVDPQDHIIVADTGNSRITVFGTVATLTNFSAPSFSLTTGVSSPESIAMESNGQFWVADPGNNQVYHYASVSQLPIANYASDSSVSAVSPRSVAADAYNNLVVVDGIDRVLYYAPALGVVNAANYIKGRALSPGALAAIFPAVSTNVLAMGTEINNGTFPLPTTLAGTQVLINGTPSPLLYVSPGQINFPLSMSLPTGGNVDVQVVSQATGQIFGGTEIPLSSASPGLFAGVGGTGTGQVAALNQDNSINSATNPLTRGQVLQLFATGQGPVPNPPPDGQSPTAIQTPGHPQILIGNPLVYVPDANIQYSGLAPGLVGLWQINFTVPTTIAAGNAVPIVVIMNSVPSNNPAAPAQTATTVALK